MALLFRSSVDSAARWSAELARLMPGLDIRVWPQIGDPAAIDYALVWRPEPGMLAALPNLKLILSLGAGVDHVLVDPQLPAGVPIVRLVDPYLTDAMSEFVVLQVLRLHRHDLDYRAQQQALIWRELSQKNAGERPVGILGFGEIGQDAARKLAHLGFLVSGWGRRERTIAGFATFAGSAGLPRLLAQSEILVCLLPLTSGTRGILNARTFALLPRGAALVNAGRGGHLVEADLIPALDQWPALGRRTRRLPRRAAAARSPVLAPPADSRHPAYRRHHQPRDRRPDRARHHPPLRRGPPAPQPGRSSTGVLSARKMARSGTRRSLILTPSTSSRRRPGPTSAVGTGLRRYGQTGGCDQSRAIY